MPVICRTYGHITEITEFERKPKKVRVHTSRKRNPLYGPRRSDNIRRTRTTCVRRVFSALKEFGCPLLVTLTFRGDASDASYANDSLRVFQVRMRTAFPNAHSLFVPELSPKGRIHFHGLLFNVPLHLGDTRGRDGKVSYGLERKDRTLAKLWGEGFVDVRQTDGSPKLGYYITKYITKGSGETLFNAMRILRISHGFPKETVYRDELAQKTQHEYASRKPFKEWAGDNIFLGKMTKKTYNDEL